ncbi:Ig-like domain-containing protein [Mariniluteicoccus endophyticus]
MRTLRRLPTILVTVLALALVVAAIVVPGSPAAEVRLHDGSIWVTNAEASRIRRLSHQIDRFTTTVAQSNREMDVLQDGNAVVARDLRSNQIMQVDPATAMLGQPVFVPQGSTVALGRDTVAIVNPTNGRMWARPLSGIGALDTLRARADVDLGPGGTATVTTSGQAIGLSVERAQLVRPGSDRAPVKVPITMRPGDGVQVSAVGDRAVVLSRATRQLWIEGGDAITLDDGGEALLQQPSAEAERATIDRPGPLPGQVPVDAVYATPNGLYALVGSEVVALGPRLGRTPAPPMVVEGCAYGVFGGGDAQVVTACRDRGVTTVDVPQVPERSELVLRRNRDVPVLNDGRTGTVWLLAKGMRRIDDWDPAIEKKTEERGNQANNDGQSTVPNRSPVNRPPVAQRDQVSVRAGRTTAIPVLDNDTDPDGDILTVEGPPDTSAGTLGLVRGGTALQLTVPSDGRDFGFDYTINDGRGGKATARVSVKVLPADQQASNQAPVRRARHDDTLEIASGGRETRRVLLDWVDPDGDDLILVGARAPGDDEVVFTPDGTLTFTDVGKETGAKEITVDISDGVTTTQGIIKVNAKKQGTVPPRANGDFVSSAVDQETTVRPMLNDVGEHLTLAAVSLERGSGDATVTPDFSGGSFTFRASRAGTYYVNYTISNGPRSTGLVRVDVTEPAVRNRPPTAARDVALLPAGGSIQVDPLLNDEDPDGDVLALQSVGQHPDLKVEMRQRRGLQISADNTPKRPVALPYTVSDGQNQATGTIIVMPAPAVSDPRPLAAPDEAVVRVGQTVSVDVLANDTSPAGSTLSLDPKIVEQPAPGVAWTDKDTVRFTAPRVPGEYRAVYQVHDELGQTASAQVRFVAVDAKVENTAPQPKKVEGRVLAGSRGRVLIPLQGIDPQGDAVRLLGLDSAPRLGRVVGVHEHWLEYEAYPDSAGTDTFTYAVTDSQGARATGEVRVGVVPRDATNVAPATTDDRVTARPGRRIRVPVLANDSDADGDRFGFVDQTVEINPITDPLVDKDWIEVTVPQEGEVQGTYRVIDTRGAESSGTFVVAADPNAPLQPPTARDDIIGADKIANNDEVAVPVLADDLDPDGDLRLAQVRVPALAGGEQPPATVDGDRVRVRVGDMMRQVRYEVVDSDGLVGSGLITVPGRADATPVRLPGVRDPVATAGEALDLDISGYVIGTGGRDVTLVSDKRVWASDGDVEVLDLRRIRYRPRTSYKGPAAITFEVTDGANSSDPSGRRAVITLPTEVLPAPKKGEEPTTPDERLNRPPLSQPIQLKVGAGEGPKTIDLARLVTDPDKDPVTFTKPSGDVPTGVRVELDGTKVTASAELTTRPGTLVRLTGEAFDDRKGRAPVVIEVAVVASARPRARALDDVVQAQQGKAASVPVLANDTNPFPDRGPLVLTSAVVESGRGTAQMDGDKVVVTPAGDYVGQLVVRYQVEDATKTPERRAEGRVRLTVKGKPSRPGVPRVLEEGDQSVVLQWNSSHDNGAKVERYVVRWDGGEQQCQSTTCTIKGLTNNKVYAFTVTALNAIGESERSAASREARPDVRPDPPGTPRARFGDRQISLDWDAANSRGSAVREYEVEIDAGNGVTRRTASTALTWGNLANGQAYRFRVRAHNLAPRPSEWSQWSRPEVPAAPPSAPGAVTATETSSSLGREFDLAWRAPARTNGDAVRTYIVLDGARELTRVSGASPRARVTLDVGQTYRFTVVAENKAGRSGPSPESEAVKPYAAPDKPAPPQITDEVDSVRATQPFATRTNGAPVTQWQVRVGDRDPVVGAAQDWVGSAPTGAVTIRIRACAQARCSPWSDPSNQVQVLGRPSVPQVSKATDTYGHEVARWRAGSRTGGRAIQAVEVEVDGQVRRGPVTGEQIAGDTVQARAKVRVRATNGRHWSDWTPLLTITNPRPAIDAKRGQSGGGQTQVKASGAHLFGKQEVECQVMVNNRPVGAKRKLAVDPASGVFTDQVVANAPANATDVRVTCDGFASDVW